MPRPARSWKLSTPDASTAYIIDSYIIANCDRLTFSHPIVMTSHRLQDVSLYELALSSESPPHPLQISPTTFKSMVGTVIDLLIEQKIPATLWLKLPRGNVWQGEIDRYRKLANAPHSIYVLKTQRDDVEKLEATNGTTESALEPEFSPAESDLVDDQGEVLATATAYSRSITLPLLAESQLRREYFLLVLSPEFHGLVLAHRPRSVKPHKDSASVQEAQAAIAKPAAADEDLERKHPLLGLCSFDSQTIERVLGGVNRAIQTGQTQTEPAPETDELLDSWDSSIAMVTNAPLDPIALGRFFTRQIQRQEEIWHNSALFRKQAETAVALQMENEELLNSIRIKDEFLKNVGQELRTPLSSMKTALTLLNSPNIKPAQRQRYMEMLSHECDRQSSLITSVLELVQLEHDVDQSHAQPLRLADVVPGVVSTYQPLAQEKGVMLAYTIPEDLPAVSCLSNWLRQIVINLLHNGIKFTPKGGRVWVRAKQQGDYIQIEFQDTGLGISQTDIPKIFDRFYRVRSTTGDDLGGAGLGLSIVQQLLLRSGGSISVKSKLGEGSAFTVLLPIYHS